MAGPIKLRPLALILGGLLVATTMVGIAAAASPRVARANAADPASKVTGRPDSTSAMVAAIAQGTRVEDLSSRTPSSATFANPDSTWTTEAYSGLVRSKDDSDEWVPVDPTLEKAGGSYEPSAIPVDVQYSDGQDKVLGTATTPDGDSVEVGWPSNLPEPQVAGDTLTYPGAAHGDDLVVESHPDGFDYSMVLDEAPAAGADQLEYRIPIAADGLGFTVADDGSIFFKDGSKSVATMSAPIMWDNSAQNDGRIDHSVSATVEGEGNSRVLVLKPDMDYLRDSATVYPVTVDPVFSIAASGDTWVNNTDHTSSQFNSTELQVGSISLGITKARSYLSFDLSGMQGAGMTGTPLSANLTMSNFQTGACPSGTAVRVSRVTGSMSIPSISWSSQPTTTATNSVPVTTAFGSGSCPEAPVAWDIAPMVGDAMATGSLLNVQVKADSESAQAGYRKYRSLENGNSALAPKLSVTYDRVPSTPTGVSAAPGNPGYATSLTPMLTAVVTDPDGGQVRGNLVVKNHTSGATVWSDVSNWTASGGTVEKKVASGLADGSTYDAYVYSEDPDHLLSPAAAIQTFTVDVTAPTASISSTGYTNGTWTETIPYSNQFTYTGSPDTASFDTVTDGVPKNVRPASGTSSIAYPFAPPAYWNSLQVTPIDKAGNRGSTAAFSFGSGLPGFSAPFPNAPGTSSFPLDVSAPPNASGVSLWWKLHSEPTTAWRTPTHVTKDGSTWSGAVATSGGHSQTGQLVWNATAEAYGSGTLSAPAVVDLKSCFHYSAAADKCAYPVTVQLVPSGFGQNFPVASVGPAKVALFTGEMSLEDMDGQEGEAGLGRTFSSFDSSTLSSGIFGPGWSDLDLVTGVSQQSNAEIVDNRGKDGTFVVVDQDTGSRAYTLASGTTYKPIDPSSDRSTLELVAGSPDRLVQTRPVGTESVVTTWELQNSSTGGPTQWVLSSVNGPGSSSNIAVTATNQRPQWIRTSDPGAATTCTPTTQTLGCRALQFSYTGTGSATRLASVTRVIGADSPAAPHTSVIATYSYDSSGRLQTACTGLPSPTSPALCNSYGYVSVGGRTLLSQLAPSGLKAWRFAYDTSGRLTTVQRERPSGGDSTWTVDYNMSISPTTPTPGLPNLTTSNAAQWGQITTPTRVFAVYEPQAGATDISQARLFFTTDSGVLTNTAAFGHNGWDVETVWLDEKGHQVQHLDAYGWHRVQSVINPADRPRVAAEASSYTIYNDWGNAETANSRIVEEFGPVHTVALKDGTIGSFRTHHQTIYDDDPAVDPALVADRPGSAGLQLVVEEQDSVSSPNRTSDFDVLTTKYGYKPNVTGDGSGWDLGAPTSVSKQIDASNWATARSRFDAEGNPIATTYSGGSTDANGAGSDAMTTNVTNYVAAPGPGDCQGRREWEGLPCKETPSVQPPNGDLPTTFYAAYNDDLKPSTVEEISGNDVVRTSTTNFDDIGRPTDWTQSTSSPLTLAESRHSTMDYDPATGYQTQQSLNGQSVVSGFDSWGRLTSYSDALGTSSSTTYDSAGRVESAMEGSVTYDYSYDATGLPTSVDISGVGTYSYAFNDYGYLTDVTYPNGVVARRTYDEIGLQTGLSYALGGSTLLTFGSTNSASGLIVAQTSSASAQQFTRDGLGRLTSATDKRTNGCFVRQYAFNARSNRTGFSSFGPDAATGACQTSVASSTRSWTYDSAGRNTSSGYAYDALGRTTLVPSVDTGPDANGPLTATYHSNDMIASLSQSVQVGGGALGTSKMTYDLDPTGRINGVTSALNGVETKRLRYRYSSGGDSPSAIETSIDAGASWSANKYVRVPGLGMAAVVGPSGVEVELTNPHGDIVGGMSSAGVSSSVTWYSETDEFGRPTDASARPRYQWLGSLQRSGDANGGLLLMGARVYNPSTGTFLTADPVGGGNATPYGYPEDPVGFEDPTGKTAWVKRLNPATKGERVYLYDSVTSHILRDHNIGWTVVADIVTWSGPRGATSSDGIDRGMYKYKLYEYVNGKRNGRWCLIEFVIEWGDGVRGQGFLTTAYPIHDDMHALSSMPRRNGKTWAPNWVRDDLALGPPNFEYSGR